MATDASDSDMTSWSGPSPEAGADRARFDDALAWLRANEGLRSPWGRKWLLIAGAVFVGVPAALAWLGLPHPLCLWGVFVLLMSLAGIAVLLVLMVRANAGDSVGQTGWGVVLRTGLSECVATARLFLLEMGVRSSQCPNIIGAKYRGQTAVILVHGFHCHRSAWNPWLRRWASVNRPCVAINLGPTEGHIMDHAPVVAQAIQSVRAITGRDPVVVGHSLGGLALRAWWQSRPLITSPARSGLATAGAGVARLVTLGTPHQGSRLARLSRTPSGIDMRPSSDFLNSNQHYIETHGLPETWAWLTPTDVLVTPASSAALAPPPVGPVPENRITVPCGHNALLQREDIMGDVLALVTALDAQDLAPA